MTIADLAWKSQVVDRPDVRDGGFAEMRAAMAAAVAARPEQVHAVSMTFAGRPVRLEVAGNALAANVMSAFAHLIDRDAPDRPATSSIAFWDCTASGVRWPNLAEDGEWVAQGEGWRISLHGGGRYLREARTNSLIHLDRSSGAVIAAFRDAAQLTLADRARPLQRMMSQICAAFGIQDIHAGLVSRGGRGVLIVGGSGRGKTTTTLDCLDGGLDFLGDDSVGLGEPEEGGFVGHSLYNSARVHPGQLRRWPRLADHWRPPGPGDDKALLIPARPFPERVVRTARIVAILVPVIAGGRFDAVPTSPRAAFTALVHDSKDNRRFGMSRNEFLRLTALTRTIPCFRCELDLDPARVAAGISHLIESLAP
jgi:hypothetical protein